MIKTATGYRDQINDPARLIRHYLRKWSKSDRSSSEMIEREASIAEPATQNSRMLPGLDPAGRLMMLHVVEILSSKPGANAADSSVHGSTHAANASARRSDGRARRKCGGDRSARAWPQRRPARQFRNQQHLRKPGDADRVLSCSLSGCAHWNDGEQLGRRPGIALRVVGRGSSSSHRLAPSGLGCDRSGGDHAVAALGDPALSQGAFASV